jgi:hypothetical protein
VFRVYQFAFFFNVPFPHVLGRMNSQAKAESGSRLMWLFLTADARFSLLAKRGRVAQTEEARNYPMRR